MTRPIDLMFVCLLVAPAAVKAQPMFQPGQWESTTTIKSMEMPGMSPQATETMKSRMGGGKSTMMSHCLTPEQAARGPQEMFKQNSSCHVTNFSTVGGTVSIEMTCSQNGGTMTIRSNGTYTPTSYSATGTMVMTGKMSMRITSSSVGRRIGPCTGK